MLGGEGAVMTATLNDVTKKKAAELSAEQQAAKELVRRAREQGLSLTGPDGLLKQLTKTVLETALNQETTENLGYEKHDPDGAGTGNVRNGASVSKETISRITDKVIEEMNDWSVRPLDERRIPLIVANQLAMR